MKHRIAKPAAALLALLSAPLFAHHGTNASYDLAKQVTMTGTVTEFVWQNPHCQIYFDVKDEHGNIVHWAGETNSPGVLSRDGWSRKIMRPGDSITITVSPSKANTPVGVVRKIVLPDGRVLTRLNAID
ncbi:MAG TPA: DUF6152 family protein [Bryobacteraceae bacterium]|nr:DUF6152 family protein [Bryobacteraceae bacterium]